MMGPIKFLFYRAARDYADYRIIQAEKAQAAMTRELSVARRALDETTSELMELKSRYRDLIEKKFPSVVVSNQGLRAPELEEGVGA